jgi:putative endonuclease
MGYVVYILHSEKLDGYYAGHTDNLEKWLATHDKGGKKYTTKGVPWSLVKNYNCANRSEAIILERRIKKRGIKRYLDEN